MFADDTKSHNAGAILLGQGAMQCKSSKQKLNDMSSTQAETIGVSDNLPNMIRTKLFLEEQGYKINDNIVKQDNKSAI